MQSYLSMIDFGLLTVFTRTPSIGGTVGTLLSGSFVWASKHICCGVIDMVTRDVCCKTWHERRESTVEGGLQTKQLLVLLPHEEGGPELLFPRFGGLDRGRIPGRSVDLSVSRSVGRRWVGAFWLSLC